MRVWDLKGSKFSSPTILYDHEEEIVSAAVHQQLVASLDTEGTLILRDITNNLEIISQIRLNRQFESGEVLFNQRMKNEVIMFYNNQLDMWDVEGRLIESKELDGNVVAAVQDEDTVVFAYEGGPATLGVYDWRRDQVVEERQLDNGDTTVKALAKG
jgi:hypothetical protein